MILDDFWTSGFQVSVDKNNTENHCEVCPFDQMEYSDGKTGTMWQLVPKHFFSLLSVSLIKFKLCRAMIGLKESFRMINIQQDTLSDLDGHSL